MGQLNYLQCALLLGLGFQKKSVDELAREMKLIHQQTLSMLNKAVRKMYALVDKVMKEHVQRTEIEPQFPAADTKDAKEMRDPMEKLQSELDRLAKGKRWEEVQEKVPDVVSVLQRERLVTMPKNENSNAVDPAHRRAMDKAAGINPSDRFHWNAGRRKERSEKVKKLKGKAGRKARESKILDVYKKQRKGQKTKQRREQVFESK